MAKFQIARVGKPIEDRSSNGGVGWYTTVIFTDGSKVNINPYKLRSPYYKRADEAEKWLNIFEHWAEWSANGTKVFVEYPKKPDYRVKPISFSIEEVK